MDTIAYFITKKYSTIDIELKKEIKREKKDVLSNIRAAVLVSGMRVGIAGITTPGTVVSDCYTNMASLSARGLTNCSLFHRYLSLSL